MGRNEKLRMKVWRQPGWGEGDAMLWRAQIYDARERVISRIGVGPTRAKAIEDCVALFDAEQIEAEWISMDEARSLTVAA